MNICISLFLYLFLMIMSSPELHSHQDNGNQYVGVIDRIEGNNVVILLEEAEEELILPAQEIGEPVEIDQWLLVRIDKAGPVFRRSLPQIKQEREEEISQLLEKLKGKILTSN